MKPFNLVTINPTGYVQGGALTELKRYVFLMLQACGYEVTETHNSIYHDSYNIFFNSHIIQSRVLIDNNPNDSIVFNTEQLEPEKSGKVMATNGSVYGELLARCTVWDYSLLNLPVVPHERKSLIPLLHCEAMRSDISRAPNRNLLFYGSLSPSRKKTIADIRATRVPLETLLWVYGRERDLRMLQSWAVLNLHRDIPYIENRHQFESVRCFWPLICGVPVISDTSIDPTAKYYQDFILFSARESLLEMIQWLYDKPLLDFEEITAPRLEQFKKTEATALFSIKQSVDEFLQSLT